jgi:hypothetical protein
MENLEISTTAMLIKTFKNIRIDCINAWLSAYSANNILGRTSG